MLADRKTGGHIEGDIRVNGHKKEADTFARVSGYGEQPLQTRDNPHQLTLMDVLEHIRPQSPMHRTAQRCDQGP